MSLSYKTIPAFLFAVLLGVALLMTAPIAQADDEAVGRIKIVRGDATVIRQGVEKTAELGMLIYAQDIPRTTASGRMGLTFKDNSRYALGPDSEVAITDFTFDSTTHEGSFATEISAGSVSIASGKIAKADPEAMTVRTPSKVVGVRGTNFLVKVH